MLKPVDTSNGDVLYTFQIDHMYQTDRLFIID